MSIILKFRNKRKGKNILVIRGSILPCHDSFHDKNITVRIHHNTAMFYFLKPPSHFNFSSEALAYKECKFRTNTCVLG